MFFCGCNKTQIAFDEVSYKELIKVSSLHLKIKVGNLIQAVFQVENSCSEVLILKNLDLSKIPNRPESIAPIFYVKNKLGEMFCAYSSESKPISIVLGKSSIVAIFKVEDKFINLMRSSVQQKNDCSSYLRLSIDSDIFYAECTEIKFAKQDG